MTKRPAIVNDVLKSDFLTQGPIVPAFEKAVSDYCKSKYAFAVNSIVCYIYLMLIIELNIVVF